MGYTGADLDACQTINSDFIGWLQIPGTKVDYPVVLTNDVDYYLDHTFDRQENIILCDYLEQSHKGEGAAISSKELERILHVKGTVIRRLVNILRSESKPICSNAMGYFYAANQ